MRTLLAVTIGALALASLSIPVADHPAWSQAARTIRVVISVPPGGSIDLLVRIMADHLSSTQRQSVIVESRPGAGGVIAADADARAPPARHAALEDDDGVAMRHRRIGRRVTTGEEGSEERLGYLVTALQIIVVTGGPPSRALAELAEAAG